MMEEQAVIWSPWKDVHLHNVAPLGLAPSCYNDATLWLTTCHLVFSNMVESYAPQRVMRQFGLFQQVPPQPTRGLDESTHEYVPDFILIENYIYLHSSTYILIPQTTEEGRSYGKPTDVETNVGHKSSFRVRT